VHEEGNEDMLLCTAVLLNNCAQVVLM